MTSNLVVFHYDKSKWQSKPCFCGSPFGLALAFATAKPPQNRRLCLPQRACALAVMRLDRHGFANKFLIRWNYNTIFHFCGRNLQIFSKKCYEKTQKRASKAENKGWGGGFCVFVKFFGALFGFGKFFRVCWIFGLCLESVEKFSWNLFNFFQNFGEILNLFGIFKILLEVFWIFLEFLKNLVILSVSEKSIRILKYALNLWILRYAQYDKDFVILSVAKNP